MPESWESKQKRFWRECRDKYNPQAFAMTVHPHPRAPLVGHLFSGGWGSGVRYWAFATVADRDKFVAKYGDKNHPLRVQPCSNPIPKPRMVEDDDEPVPSGRKGRLLVRGRLR